MFGRLVPEHRHPADRSSSSSVGGSNLLAPKILYSDQPTAVVEVEVDCTVLYLKVNHLGSGRATRLP